MNLDQLFADAESKISTIAGGATTLSDPSENWPDPFVQSTGIVLAGQYELDKKIDTKWDSVDIRKVDCECLEVVAARTGDFKRTNKASKTCVFVTGISGTILPANSVFVDNFSRTWLLESEIAIENCVGFGTVVSSSAGDFDLSAGELSLQTPVTGIEQATNTCIIERGYEAENCEQFRTRLLNKTVPSIETENTLMTQLALESDFVKTIGDYPDCDTGCTGFGFVIRGGDSTTIANIIRQYAPVNYMNLAGNTQVDFDNCEYVKFIRPCPVAIQLQYTGKEELDPSLFSDVVCTLNGSVYHKAFNDLDITSIKFRTIRATPADLNCEDVEEGDDCGNTVSLLTGIAQDCPCVKTECSSPDFISCAVLESWEYPVFANVEYMGTDCD